MSDNTPTPPENTTSQQEAAPVQSAPPVVPQVSPHPGSGQPPLSQSDIQSKKLAAGLLGILLGGFGIHKFYLGYTQEGVIMLVATLLSIVGTMVTCGLLAPLLMVMSIIGLIEGILYLTKSEEEFANTYVYGRKAWF